MHPDAPNRRYYTAMQGRWRGAYRLALTDEQALRRSGLGWSARMRVRAMAALGEVAMETSLDARSITESGRVEHRTRFVKWGVTLFRSTEAIVLAGDGRHATLSGSQMVDCPVAVDADAAGARYEMRWLGASLLQETRIVGDGELRVVQHAPWFRGEVTLVRFSRGVS